MGKQPIAKKAAKKSPTRKARAKKFVRGDPSTLGPGESPLTGTRPPKDHQWPKGVSGNPKGRPKNVGARIVEYLTVLSEEPEDELKAIVNDKELPLTKRAAARQLIKMVKDGPCLDRVLDRSIGKPKMSIAHEGALKITVKLPVNPEKTLASDDHG